MAAAAFLDWLYGGGGGWRNGSNQRVILRVKA